MKTIREIKILDDMCVSVVSEEGSVHLSVIDADGASGVELSRSQLVELIKAVQFADKEAFPDKKEGMR